MANQIDINDFEINIHLVDAPKQRARFSLKYKNMEIKYFTITELQRRDNGNTFLSVKPPYLTRANQYVFFLDDSNGWKDLERRVLSVYHEKKQEQNSSSDNEDITEIGLDDIPL